MDHLFLIIGIVVLSVFLAYNLYLRGYGEVKSQSTLMHVGMIGRPKNGIRERYLFCTRYSKRVLNFDEDGDYAFELDCDLKKGEVRIELLDEYGVEVIVLDEVRSAGIARIERDVRYRLVTHIKGGSGKHSLSWKKVER